MSEAYFESMERVIKRMNKWSTMSAEERKILVAIHIFGWKPEKRKRYAGVDNVKGWGINQHLGLGDADRKFHSHAYLFDDWPTSIAAAFEVVEKMRELDKDCRCSITEYTGEWRCSFGKHHAYAKTPAEAICLAALRASNVEVE